MVYVSLFFSNSSFHRFKLLKRHHRCVDIRRFGIKDSGRNGSELSGHCLAFDGFCTPKLATRSSSSGRCCQQVDCGRVYVPVGCLCGRKRRLVTVGLFICYSVILGVTMTGGQEKPLLAVQGILPGEHVENFVWGRIRLPALIEKFPL